MMMKNQNSKRMIHNKASSTFGVSMMMMMMMTLVVVVVPVQAHESTFGLHGSGTTNPSRCYWTIMETLREQTIVPLHTTYRGIGSTNGMMEFAYPFLNNTANDENYATFFGSGDIPLTNDLYTKITTATGSTKSFVHIPVLAGTVSFFYSAPNVTDETSPVTNLNLTACVLAQIYTQQITQWNDNAILNLNPQWNVPSTADMPIIVIRRSEGSSSTHAATNVRVLYM